MPVDGHYAADVGALCKQCYFEHVLYFLSNVINMKNIHFQYIKVRDPPMVMVHIYENIGKDYMAAFNKDCLASV